MQTGRPIKVNKIDNSMVHVKETCECEGGTLFSQMQTCLCENYWERTTESKLRNKKTSNRVSDSKFIVKQEIYEYSKNGNWRLNIDNLQINGTNLDLNMTNVKVKKMKFHN